MKKRDIAINFFRNSGFVEIEPNTRKAVVCFLNEKSGNKYWVGKAGSIRSGKIYSKSVSITHYFKPYKEWERKRKEEKTK